MLYWVWMLRIQLADFPLWRHQQSTVRTHLQYSTIQYSTPAEYSPHTSVVQYNSVQYTRVKVKQKIYQKNTSDHHGFVYKKRLLQSAVFGRNLNKLNVSVLQYTFFVNKGIGYQRIIM